MSCAHRMLVVSSMLVAVEAWSLQPRALPALGRAAVPLPSAAHHRLQMANVQDDGPAASSWWPRGDSLDANVWQLLLPSVASLVVVPLTGAVDTIWVGKMGDVLSLAAQGAANRAPSMHQSTPLSLLGPTLYDIAPPADLLGPVAWPHHPICATHYVLCPPPLPAELFSALFILVSFVPTVTVPLVAQAYAAGDLQGARARTCEAIYLATTIGLLVTLALLGAPQTCLRLVLPPGAPAAALAARYLRVRALGLVPALISAVGFAAFRGMLDMRTPLRVSCAANLFNLLLDPILIFGVSATRGFGVVGAAIATVFSEAAASVIYVVLLLRRRLVSWLALRQPPRIADTLPLIRGSSTMLVRSTFWNVALLTRARLAQSIDPSGVSAAAYAIVREPPGAHSAHISARREIRPPRLSLLITPPSMACTSAIAHQPLRPLLGAPTPSQGSPDTLRSTHLPIHLLTSARDAPNYQSLQLYLVGCIVASALQGTAAAMVASALTRSSTEARRVSERLIGWGLMLGGAVCALQLATLLAVVPLFTPLPQVQNAAFRPTAMAAVVQLVNVPCYAAEGVAIGCAS